MGEGLGGWSCIVRFACHAPMGIMAFSGKGVYDAVKGLESTGIYDLIPAGREFLYGLQMYSTWGIFGFAWNFVMFLGCFACFSWLLVLLGLVDSMIAISLLVSVVKQSHFIPQTYSACGGATDWRNATDGRNFFILANATTSGTWNGPNDICHGIVEIWAYAISMSILYLLTGIINVLLGVGEAGGYSSRSYSSYNYNNSYRRQRCRGFCSGFGELILWILTPALWVLDHPLAACRFGFRYLVKALTGSKKIRGDGRAFSRRQRKKASASSKDLVEKELDSLSGRPLVLPLEVLITISEDLHYVDLVSASQSSAKLRRTLFGDWGMVPEKLESLRQFACREPKSSCEQCGIQTCPECEQKVAVAPSMASMHTTHCKPYCSRCYYKEYCRWKGANGQRLAKHTPTCQLREQKKPKKGKGADVELGLSGIWNGSPFTSTEKTLCGMCASMTPAQRAERLEARDELELVRLEKHPLRCGRVDCRKMLLPGELRWWICGLCFTECPSRWHPARG